VRSTDGVSLQASQAKVFRTPDGARDFEDLLGRGGAGAMIADVEIDQKIDGLSRGEIVPGDLMNVIDDGHCAGSGDARDFRGIGERRREQNTGNFVFRHELGFGDGGDADADRAMGDLTEGDLDALVSLRVWSEMLAGFFRTPRHAREVLFEQIEVEQQGGRGDLIFMEHRSIMIFSCSILFRLIPAPHGFPTFSRPR